MYEVNNTHLARMRNAEYRLATRYFVIVMSLYSFVFTNARPSHTNPMHIHLQDLFPRLRGSILPSAR